MRVQMASACISMTNLVVSDWHMEASPFVLFPLSLTLNQIRFHFKVYLDVTVAVV